MKTKKTIRQIILEVSEAIGGGLDAAEALTDETRIRTALNNAIDAAVKAGQMTERAANNWSQTRAVRAVKTNLRQLLTASICRAMANLNKRHTN